MNKVIENMLTRRSVRSFKNKQISEEDLNTILMAGSYAPTGMGMQSWKFTAVQNTATLRRINEVIRKGISSLPIEKDTLPYTIGLIERAQEKNAEFIFNTPTYILVSNLKDNRNSMADCALALGNMMLAAHSLGIGSCWLNQLPGLTNMPIIRELLNNLDIPENHDVYGSVAMGYRAEEPGPAAPRKDVINIIR